MLEGEEAAGAADPALHLVGDEDHAVPVAERAHLLPEVRRCNVDAAAALDGFENDDADGRIALEGAADGVDIAEGHLDVVVEQAELAAIERPVGDRQHALGLAVEGVLGIDDARPLRAGSAFGHLDGRFHGFRTGGAEEDHVEIAGRDFRKVLGKRRGILRHEGNRDLVAVLVLELLARRDDARMVVAEGQRPEAAEEIENLPAVLVDVVHAFGSLDLDLVEAEQLHEMQLAGVQVILEERRHVGDAHLLGLFHRHQVRLADRAVKLGGVECDAVRSVEHGRLSPHSAGTAAGWA